MYSSPPPVDGTRPPLTPLVASAPLSLLSPNRGSPRSANGPPSFSARASLSSPTPPHSSSAVYPYPHSPPTSSLHPFSAEPIAPSSLGSRHHRHHSTGSSTATSSSSTPARRSPYPPDDDAGSFSRSSTNGSSVSLQIRSRGGDSDGRGRGGGSSHGRNPSDEDARGLKKGRKFSCWKMLPLAALLLVSLVSMTWMGWAFWTKDSRSSAVTVVLPFVPLTTVGGSSDQLAGVDQLVFAALASWLHVLKPTAVVVYMESLDACSTLTAQFPGLLCFHLPQCQSTVPPLPDLTCVLSHTLSLDEMAPTLLLLSTPLALDRRLLDAASYVSTHLPRHQQERWLMVGARTDVSLTGMAAREWASEGFAGRLFSEGSVRGVQHGEHAMEALLMSRGLLSWLLEAQRLPPFIAGAGHWAKFVFVQSMLNDSATVLDMTIAVPLLHLQLVGSGASEAEAAGSPLQQLRAEADHAHEGSGLSPAAVDALAHNHELVQGSMGVKMALGSLQYTPFILEGDCPDACVISPNPNSRWQSAVVFTQRVNPDGYLAVLTVNSGYLALAKNWLCWAERIGFSNFILLAEDKRSAETLSSPTVAVIIRPHAPYQKDAADYGSVEFQETMSFRTDFLLEVLDVGYHFMTADMDAIWLSDPFDHVDQAADLSGQTHKKVKLSGGLVIVRASEAGRAFWKEVIRCQRGNAKFLAEHAVGTYEPSLYTEQYCINQLYLVQPAPPAFTRTLLDPWLFPDGLSFFEQQQPQHAGVVPVIIHNNWIKGSDAKLRRMKEWGLTSTDDSNTQCAAIPSPPSPVFSTSPATPAGFSLIIRVLARSSPADLTALLTALAGMECAGCGEVTLQVDVDRRPEVEDMVIEQTVARHSTYLHLVDTAQQFEWKKGPKIVREGKRRRGRMGQWLDGWPAAVDERVLYLLLDEYAQLSPDFFPFLVRAVQCYYLGEGADSRMVGMQWEREELVLSDTYWSRWPDRSTAQLLHRNASLYRYQSMSPHAQLMFPAQLQRFIGWVEERSVDHATSLPPATTNNHITPCIPLMVSNQWYLPQGDVQQTLMYETEDVWWVWMQRWMYEEGLYSLVTHFPRSHALVTHPLGKAGIFLNSTERGPLVPAGETETWELPLLSSLPLFSFGFSPLSSSSLLSVLPQLSPNGLSVQCYSIADYEEEQRLRAEAEDRKRAEDELKARAAAEAKAKKSLSDAMKREKRKAEMNKAKEEEEKRPFAVELEGG